MCSVVNKYVYILALIHVHCSLFLNDCLLLIVILGYMARRLLPAEKKGKNSVSDIIVLSHFFIYLLHLSLPLPLSSPQQLVPPLLMGVTLRKRSVMNACTLYCASHFEFCIF